MSLAQMLHEQQELHAAIHQDLLPQRVYLASVSPLLLEGSPVRSSRAASANPGSRKGGRVNGGVGAHGSGGGGGGSVNASAISSGTPVKGGAAAVAVAATPGSQRAERLAILGTSPPVPPAPDAYMNELPLPPYGSTAHLSLHVTDTLELALRVLAKNSAVGRALTARDVELIAAIHSFGSGAPPPSSIMPPGADANASGEGAVNPL